MGIHIAQRNRRVLIGKWTPPHGNVIKINVDGSMISGMASIGGIARNHQSIAVFGFFEFLQDIPILQAELLAIQRAIEFNKREYIQRIWVESDCLTAIHLLNRQSDGPWNSQATILHIRKMIKDYNVVITHTFREGNKPADYLAKKGIELRAAFFWKGSSIDRTLRRLMVADLFPFLRIRENVEDR